MSCTRPRALQTNLVLALRHYKWKQDIITVIIEIASNYPINKTIHPSTVERAISLWNFVPGPMTKKSKCHFPTTFSTPRLTSLPWFTIMKWSTKVPDRCLTLWSTLNFRSKTYPTTDWWCCAQCAWVYLTTNQEARRNMAIIHSRVVNWRSGCNGKLRFISTIACAVRFILAPVTTPRHLVWSNFVISSA